MGIFCRHFQSESEIKKESKRARFFLKKMAFSFFWSMRAGGLFLMKKSNGWLWLCREDLWALAFRERLRNDHLNQN
jgi:hypothetical protein